MLVIDRDIPLVQKAPFDFEYNFNFNGKFLLV